MRRRTGAGTGVERAASGVGRGVIIGGEMTLFPPPLPLSSFRAKRSGDPEPGGAEGEMLDAAALPTGSRYRAPLGPPVAALRRLAGG